MVPRRRGYQTLQCRALKIVYGYVLAKKQPDTFHYIFPEIGCKSEEDIKKLEASIDDGWTEI